MNWCHRYRHVPTATFLPQRKLTAGFVSIYTNIIIVFGLFHLTSIRPISIPTLNIQVSKEGEFFTVETEVARMSELVRGMLDGKKRERHAVYDVGVDVYEWPHYSFHFYYIRNRSSHMERDTCHFSLESFLILSYTPPPSSSTFPYPNRSLSVLSHRGL